MGEGKGGGHCNVLDVTSVWGGGGEGMMKVRLSISTYLLDGRYVVQNIFILGGGR